MYVRIYLSTESKKYLIEIEEEIIRPLKKKITDFSNNGNIEKLMNILSTVENMKISFEKIDPDNLPEKNVEQNQFDILPAEEKDYVYNEQMR
eukprot:jgi/Orpsp1_1/1180967/evm.model.c7180000075273.2